MNEHLPVFSSFALENAEVQMRTRSFRRRSFSRRRHWIWVRNTHNNSSPGPSPVLLDLLADFKTHAGITINFPEFRIWRLRLKVSITVTITGGTTASNDGVLITTFIDGMTQVPLNQLTNSQDEADMVYDFLYTYKVIGQGFTVNSFAVTAVPLYGEYDIKAHRKLKSIDDTCFLQMAASGNAVITGYSVSYAMLCFDGR